MNSYRHFSLDAVEGALVIRLKDAELLEREIFPELLDELLDVFERERPSAAVISFEFVRRLSSEAISVLLRARSELGSFGGRLYLCEMRKEIREIFRVLKLDFSIYDTLNEALDSA
jgi:anti-anti-sigma factor